MGYLELDVLNNQARSVALGIDLGTTNSLVAMWQDGRPQVLAPEGKSPRVPSVIYFPETGLPVVGERARALAMTNPRRAIFSVKRLMGRGLADVAEDAARLSFPLSEGPNGVLQIDVDGKKYTPQELSALILRAVHLQATEATGFEEAVRCVITVPAYFDDTQRQATRDAARLAGLDVLRIINEPTAASLAYGLDQKNEGDIVVYDLGGGTFDVSVLRIEDGVFRVLSTAGDTHLGGDDFDQLLVELMLQDLRGRVPDEELEDPAFRQAARLSAEKCKIALSSRNSAELHLVVAEHDVHYRRTITREEFETLAAPLVDRTLDSCRRALSDAGLAPEQADEVVLVGGSTRIPFVRSKVEELFGKKPHTELDPDQVVALGAAVQAHVLNGGERDMLLLDVVPLSLGLETVGGAVSKVIDRNSTIPCTATEVFTTYADGQTGMTFNVVQGERELAKDCRSLGRFELKGIPPMPAGLARVAVRFHVDADGILTVTAKEESTGQTASIEIQPMHGLTDEQVERMLQESYAHAREDMDARRVADLHTELGTMIAATERNLEVARSSLDPETVSDIEEALAAARAARESQDLPTVQAARDALEKATLPLAALLMDQVAKTALSGRKLDEV